jgi:hypothetical protein
MSVSCTIGTEAENSRPIDGSEGKYTLVANCPSAVKPLKSERKGKESCCSDSVVLEE